MTGYRDQSWCTSSQACANVACRVNLTEDRRQEAAAWWGEGGALVTTFPFCGTDVCEGFEPIDGEA